MSTFDGRIKEYPAISIDKFKFNGYSKYFILSHVHSDHLDGLQDDNFNKTIYCTEQSAKILPLITHSRTKRPLYAHLKNFLVPIPYHTPYQLDTVEYGIVKLTFLPANHCIGSSIVLIECKHKGTILYAQDIRAEQEFVKKELSLLLEHRIQNLYMDTTCCYADKMKFISKKKSAELLMDKLQTLDPYHHIYLDFWQLGYEEVWKYIVKKFEKKIHVSEERYNLFCTADPSYIDILTTNPTETRFHSCDWESNCSIHGKYTIAFHPIPTIEQQITAFLDSKSLLRSDLPYKADLKQQHLLPFSTHSSCSEIAAFHKFVRPKLFTPCVAHGGWDTMNKMRELLVSLGCDIGDIVLSSDSSYSYGTYSKRQRTKEPMTKTLSDFESWQTEERIITLSKHENSNSTESSKSAPLSDQTNTNSKSQEIKSQAGSLALVITSHYVTQQEQKVNYIIISSDEEDEDNKPLITPKLTQRLKRKLRQCRYRRE